MAKSQFQKWLEQPAHPKVRRGAGADLTNERWLLRDVWSNPGVIDHAQYIFGGGQRAAIMSARRRRVASSKDRAPRRCDTNICADGQGECLSCGAYQGEACRNQERKAP